jgi:hypothetical protein
MINHPKPHTILDASSESLAHTILSSANPVVFLTPNMRFPSREVGMTMGLGASRESYPNFLCLNVLMMLV